jgi:hypothetical protein
MNGIDGTLRENSKVNFDKFEYTAKVLLSRDGLLKLLA